MEKKIQITLLNFHFFAELLWSFKPKTKLYNRRDIKQKKLSWKCNNIKIDNYSEVFIFFLIPDTKARTNFNEVQ